MEEGAQRRGSDAHGGHRRARARPAPVVAVEARGFRPRDPVAGGGAQEGPGGRARRGGGHRAHPTRRVRRRADMPGR